jgi:hypothetical protein
VTEHTFARGIAGSQRERVRQSCAWRWKGSRAGTDPGEAVHGEGTLSAVRLTAPTTSEKCGTTSRQLSV